MRRKLFTAASALSLLLCVATVVLWVRSYWRYDFVGRFKPDHRTAKIVVHLARSNYGILSIQTQRDTYSDRRELVYEELPQTKLVVTSEPSRRGSLGNGFWNRLGFDHLQYNNPQRWDRETGEIVSFPYWLLCAMLAAVPALQTISVARRYRSKQRGHCQHCSYDLTGNTSGVCPECGTALAGKVGA